VLKKNTFLLFAILWTVIITFLSLATMGEMGSQIKIPNKDKIVHFVFYFLFVILWFKANKNSKLGLKKTISILFIAISYGILMEFCQKIFTTTRTADVLDALANTLGASTGYLISNHYFNNKNQ
jgi:VanZ family protein